MNQFVRTTKGNYINVSCIRLIQRVTYIDDDSGPKDHWYIHLANRNEAEAEISLETAKELAGEQWRDPEQEAAE